MRIEVIGDATLSGIYGITNTINGKVYVGSAINLKHRWIQHKSDLSLNRKGAPKLQASWNKYGAEAFSFSVIEYVPNKSDLLVREQVWINQMESITKGFNCCPVAGSPLGTKHSAEARLKMSLAQSARKRKPLSEETKKKISAAQLGIKKPPCTDEYRALMAVLTTGRKHPPRTEKYKSEVATARTGTKASAATKAKMTATHKARWAAIKGESYDL